MEEILNALDTSHGTGTGIDAFEQNWKEERGYVNPPWNQIGKILQKRIRDQWMKVAAWKISGKKYRNNSRRRRQLSMEG